MRTVVLSPHFDDAALSIGGLVRRADGPRAVVTVHGGAPEPGLPISEWDADCGFVSAAEAYAARLAEDARACAILGADQIVLAHADSPYGGDDRLGVLDELLAGLHPRASVYLPLGTNQPHHAAVRDQALETLATRTPAPRIYADLPYTAAVSGWGTESASAMLARSVDCGLAYQKLQSEYGLTVLCDIRLDDREWVAKRDAILCYASQLSPVSIMDETRSVGALLRHPGPLGFELVWELGGG